MKKYKGAVFFDYDGTLADEKCGIFLPTETSKNALKKLSRNGYMTVLNSGRSKASVFDMGIDFDGYVLMNGTYAEVDGNCIFKSPFKKEQLFQVVSILDTLDVDYFCETDGKAYVNNPNGAKFNEYMEIYQLDKRNFLQLKKNDLPNTYKIQVIYKTAENFLKLKNSLPNDIAIDDHKNEISTDISQKSISKNTGAEKICEYFNIPKSNTYAFGDNTNDYDMIKYAGHGIAMGNHSPELEEVAEFITDTVKNEGIYKALVKYGLITP